MQIKIHKSQVQTHAARSDPPKDHVGANTSRAHTFKKVTLNSSAGHCQIVFGYRQGTRPTNLAATTYSLFYSQSLAPSRDRRAVMGTTLKK